MDVNLKGWDFIVYILLKNNFKYNIFKLSDLYAFEPYFCQVYPENIHVKEKLRQTLQHLRDKGLLIFITKGIYQLMQQPLIESAQEKRHQELVYLLSNEAIPGWVKIGRTNSIDRRLKELYNTSVPLPFKIEETLITNTSEESNLLEKSIHNIIDTINPALRKMSSANRREFFRITPDEGKTIFNLVTKIMSITPNSENRIVS